LLSYTIAGKNMYIITLLLLVASIMFYEVGCRGNTNAFFCLTMQVLVARFAA